MLEINNIYNMDCLDGMKLIDDKSIDMILCDLPYGTTACKWDNIIPFEPLWECYKRIIKDNGAIVLFGSEPFSSYLRMSNIKQYKYDWIWDKITGRGHLVAKKRPLAQHEIVSIFYKNAPVYNPQMILMNKPQKGKSIEASRTSIIGGKTTKKAESIIRTHKYPKTIITQSVDGNYLHPTQKPVKLCEYLINTYTNNNELVLDNCIGSGTTAIACLNTNRNYIGFELDKNYYDIATERIRKRKQELSLF